MTTGIPPYAFIPKLRPVQTPGAVQPESWEPPARQLKRRNPWLNVLLWLFTGGIYGYWWWYAVHAELPRRTRRDWTAGTLLLGSLVPLFLPILFTLWVFDWQAAAIVPYADALVEIPEVSRETYWVYVATWVMAWLFLLFWYVRAVNRLSSRTNELLLRAGLNGQLVSTDLALWTVGLYGCASVCRCLDLLFFAGDSLFGTLDSFLVIVWVLVQSAWLVRMIRAHNALHASPGYLALKGSLNPSWTVPASP